MALAAVKGDRTLAQLAEQFDIHPNQIASWKAQLEGGAVDVFGPGGGNAVALPAIDVKSLHAKIGELTLEKERHPRHYSHYVDKFSFLKSGSKPSEPHSFTSATRLGARSWTFSVLICWLLVWPSRKTSGHVGRANDEKPDGEAVD